MEELTEEDWTKLLREKLNENITVKAVLRSEALTLGKNDQLNSNIKKIILEIEGQKETVNVICKSPLDNSFHRVVSKMALPFMKEAFWYNIAHPEFCKAYPELEELSPICYYANSNYSDRMRRPNFWRRHNCVPCILIRYCYHISTFIPNFLNL